MHQECEKNIQICKMNAKLSKKKHDIHKYLMMMLMIIISNNKKNDKNINKYIIIIKK